MKSMAAAAVYEQELERLHDVTGLRAALRLAVGRSVKARRLALGLTQSRVAQLVGTNRPLVARVEAGRHELSLGTLIRYARALQCQASDILRDAESEVA